MAGGGLILSGLSMAVGAIGDSQAASFQAQQAARGEQVAKIQADQTDAAYRQDFNTTLSNIRAIRAATGADPSSPTSLAYINDERKASDRVRMIKVGNALDQASQDAQDASFYRSAANTALLGGALQSAGKLFGDPNGLGTLG